MESIDRLSIDTIRILSAECIQRANSGHPGMAMGAAPMTYTLYMRHLMNSPSDPSWLNRDRFVLSAGHGCMMLYSLLHILGYDLTMEDLKNFRQWGSKTPGHPDIHKTPGIEVNAGPLSMGIAAAVGMAMAEAHLGKIFNRPGYPIFDHYTYAIAGDGCMMEGVGAEACSLAGHLKLGKLILFYDKNDITIEGGINLAFTEDVAGRYESYGWQVLFVEDGNNDIDAIDCAIIEAKAETQKPTLIIVKTTIGYGSGSPEGKSKAHGMPIGVENLRLAKQRFGFSPSNEFYIPDEVYAHAHKRAEFCNKAADQWGVMLSKYQIAHPELFQLYEKYFEDELPNFDSLYSFDKPMSTRDSSGEVINRLARMLPNFIGGSADLGPSNNTIMKSRDSFTPQNYTGSNLHFGVREFAMGTIANGMALHGGLLPYVATFFSFSDFMRQSVRLAALMKLPVIYVFTHDSICVGEDGPSHQPIEHLVSFRAMPGMYMWRPADSKETAAAYEFALTRGVPTALALSCHTLPIYDNSGRTAQMGAYVLCDCPEEPELIFIGSGSEVELCVGAHEVLLAKGIQTRVVSMPCMELFEEQSAEYKESVIPSKIEARLIVEAAASISWYKYSGLHGDMVTLDHFGVSAPGKVLFKKYGFTVENVSERAEKLLNELKSRA